ncbi:MAG TPA: DinB family protein [Bryobacteraceae bacterium]|jgi:uncharacterized damage-inducible protein DinB|nr:DinB family protein [Bryobacteraceae bacterium]
MKRLACILAPLVFALIAIAPLSPGEALTQGERDRAMSSLHASRKLFLDSVAGLSSEQWTFKPGPDRWSIADCAEHIALSEDFIMSMIKDKILASPSPAGKTTDRTKDDRIEAVLTDRSHKAQAPEPLQPSHKFATPQDAVEHFRKARDANIKWIETTNADLRDHIAASRALGDLDAYQWVLYMSAHTMRHTEQINEVKESPDYPKR